MSGAVFISYSRTDRAYADRLAAFLADEGIPVWFDYRLVGGEIFDEEIERQIAACAAMLVILTPRSAASQWVRREIVYADERGKAILPLVLEPTAQAPIRLSGVHAEEVLMGQLPSPGFVGRVRALAGVSTQQHEAATSAPDVPLPSPATASLASPAGASAQTGVRPTVASPVTAQGGTAGRDEQPLRPSAPPIFQPMTTPTKVIEWGSPNFTTGYLPKPADLDDVVAVAVGEFHHSLALRRGGQVISWGLNTQGQATVPAPLREVVAIAAGTGFSLGLHDDGRVTPWGPGLTARHGLGRWASALQDVVAISASRGNVLALHQGGHVTAWGPDSQPPEELRDVIAVAAGSFHCLALHRNGTVTAWGDNQSGQISVPTGVKDVVAIAAGAHHSLALHRDGHVTAWGMYLTHRFLKPMRNATVPRGTRDVVAVAAADQSFALHHDGHITVWPRASEFGWNEVPAELRNVNALATAQFGHTLAILTPADT